MLRYDIAYFRSCATAALVGALGWREDFLRNPGDFPIRATAYCDPEKTRALWRRQARLIRRVLRSRGVTP